MEEEFQGGVCQGNFWNSSRNLFASSPCSSAVNGGVGSFGWSNHGGGVVKTATSISDDSFGSATTDGGGSVAFQDVQKPHHLTEYWNQDLLHESGRSQENYSYILQALNSSTDCRTAKIYPDSSTNSNQSFPIEQHQHNSFTSLNPVPYNYTSPLMLQNLFDEQSLLDYHQMNSNEFLPKVVYPTVKPTGNNFQFINNNGDVQASFLPSMQRQLVPPSRSKANAKNHNEENGNESAMKRPRVETPSPLPAFKVRKEKLGNRITALQQLVSPFGKTDTASVLHEAIEYIKLLHDQVTVLSTPYLKNGSPPLHCQKGDDKIKDQEEDLRSRGLCLVPIASTFPVAAETSPDFWAPTFGGRFR